MPENCKDWNDWLWKLECFQEEQSVFPYSCFWWPVCGRLSGSFPLGLLPLLTLHVNVFQGDDHGAKEGKVSLFKQSTDFYGCVPLGWSGSGSVIQDLSGSWRIKGTGESITRVDSSDPLMHHNPDRSWITDSDLDHPKGTHPISSVIPQLPLQESWR